MERTPPRCPAPPGRRLSVMNKARKKVCGGCWPDRTCMGRGAPSDSAHKEGTSPGPPGVSHSPQLRAQRVRPRHQGLIPVAPRPLPP